MRVPRIVHVALLAAALLVPALAGAKVAPENNCGFKKVKAAATYVGALMKCAQKESKKGLEDVACVPKADAKLDKQHLAMDAEPSCVIDRDTATTRMLVADFAADIAMDLGTDGAPPPASKCDATRLKAVGDRAKAQAGAFAVSIKKPKPEALGKKLTKSVSKFDKNYAKGDGAGDCTATPDLVALAAKVDALIESLVALPSDSNDLAMQASPRAFETNTMVEVRVEAQVPPSVGDKIKRVNLYPLGAVGYAAGDSLCEMFDNGDLANGDDIGQDRVFTCLLQIEDAMATERNVVAVATVKGGAAQSGALRLNSVDPLSQAQAQAVVDAQAQAEGIWSIQLGALGDTLAARQAAVADILLIAGVVDAGVSSDDITIWIEYDSGVRGGLMLNPAGTRGSSEDAPTFSTEPYRFSQPSLASRGMARGVGVETFIGNGRVMIWDAYNSQFAPFDEGPDLQTLFSNSECPSFDVTYLVDAAADVDSVETFTDYGTVILVTHGAVDEDEVVFLTAETATAQTLQDHAVFLKLQEISVMGSVFAIRPGFIQNLPGSFEDALVYSGSCNSSTNETMANAFFTKGAESYFGFDDVVNSNFAQGSANQLFGEFVTLLATTSESYFNVAPLIDPGAPNAAFLRSGIDDQRYTIDLQNGDFENGDLKGWAVDGDGRVIQSLGNYSPQDGSYMGIISTGLGFTTASGQIEQTFCLDENATTLSFDWHYSSEEFIEYCGPSQPFDDPFEVEIDWDDGGTPTTTLLLLEDIDSLCDSVSPTKLFFDQSGPGCTAPDPPPGFGAGGNDCLVHTSGWQQATIDLSAIATANAGKPVKLRFKNTDSADSIFDSAVLLDGITAEAP